MLKYSKIEDTKTKECLVGLGKRIDFYKSIGMEEMEVEEAWNGVWYVKGYAPEKPRGIIIQEEITELKEKLSTSDYAVIKIAEGAATSEEYAELIKQRGEWRTRINELEAELAE